jgi:WD40 repeat protein
VTAIAWAPNGTYIASGSLDQTVQVWSVDGSKHFHPMLYRGHTAGVQAVAWSPDGSRVVSGSIDTTVQVWHAFSGERIALYQGHTDDIVMTVAWSPDGLSIASGSADGTVRVWDVATNKQKYANRDHTASVNSLVWSPDSQHIASGSSDKTVQIVDAITGKRVFSYHGHSEAVNSISWAPDGQYIVSGSSDKTAQIWHVSTGKLLYSYHGYNVQAAEHDSSKGVLPDLILAVAWSHHGKRIAASTQVYCGDSCGVLMSWDAYTEQHFTFGVDLPIFTLAWSPDDTRIATSVVVSTQGDVASKTDGPYVQIIQA